LSEGTEPPVITAVNAVPVNSVNFGRVAFVIKINKGETLHQTIADRRFYRLDGSKILMMTHAEIYNVFMAYQPSPMRILSQTLVFLTNALVLVSKGLGTIGCGLLIFGFLILGSCLAMCSQ
jgi:hypothetical protein